jgi:hypothetical protein
MTTDLAALRRCVQALAADAADQVRLFPAFVMVGDELALDFEEAMRSCRPAIAGLSERKRAAIDALDQQITALSGAWNEAFWSTDGVMSDPRWEQIRARAREVLLACGWAVEVPGPSTAIYIPADQFSVDDILRRGPAKTAKTMTREQARSAGRSAARQGFRLNSARFPTTDELFVAWLQGFREEQVFDPACPYCSGTGYRRADASGAGPYGSAMLTCDCNVGTFEE